MLYKIEHGQNIPLETVVKFCVLDVMKTLKKLFTQVHSQGGGEGWGLSPCPT